MNVSSWLKAAHTSLVGLSQSPRLDAEIILAHTIKKSRSWLHAHHDDDIELRSREIADARIDLRKDGTPVAYIIGHKEFYGRRFAVSPSVLIPRPESEEIIELLGEILSKNTELDLTTPKRLVDIGTGSGCLGITAKLEHPELDVTLLDYSPRALVIAEKNATSLSAEVSIIKSDLLCDYPFSADIVLANLPYVSRDWKLDSSIDHEPEEALYADDRGLGLIKKCFDELALRIEMGSYAIVEADPRQWNDVISYAKTAGFVVKNQRQFAYCFEKTS